MIYKEWWYRVYVYLPYRQRRVLIAEHVKYNLALTKAKCALKVAKMFSSEAYVQIETWNWLELRRLETLGRR